MVILFRLFAYVNPNKEYFTTRIFFSGRGVSFGNFGEVRVNKEINLKKRLFCFQNPSASSPSLLCKWTLWSTYNLLRNWETSATRKDFDLFFFYSMFLSTLLSEKKKNYDLHKLSRSYHSCWITIFFPQFTVFSTTYKNIREVLQPTLVTSNATAAACCRTRWRVHDERSLGVPSLAEELV